MRIKPVLILLVVVLQICSAKYYDSVDVKTFQTSSETCSLKLNVKFDYDSDNDAGSDPNYFDTALDDIAPVYTYIEIFHGKDRKSPEKGERSIICIIAYNGIGMPMFRWNLQAFSLEDMIKFETIGCSFYDVEKEKYYSHLELNDTLTVADTGSEPTFIYSLTAEGDVDAWNGWLIDQEGSDY